MGIRRARPYPRPIVDKLNEAIRKALASPDIQAYLTAEGVDTVGSTPEEFRSYLANEIRTWRQLISQAGIRLN